jgi:iron(III) transport system substrate-binding protein
MQRTYISLHWFIGLALIAVLTLTACAGQASNNAPVAEAPAEAPAPAGSQTVNVYSARHYGAVEEVMERFTAETGIEVLISQGSTQSIVERVLAEGEQTPADAVITIDGGSIQLLANEGVLATIESETVLNAIPENLRGPDN